MLRGLAHRDRVEGFAAQAEHSLGVHIAALGDAAAGRETLGDKDGTLQSTGVVGVVMHMAVAQFAVVEAGLAAALLGQFLDTGNVLTLLLVALDFLQQGVGGLGMHVKIVVEVPLEDVEDIGFEEGAVVSAVGVVGREVGGAEFGLRLCLKYRLLYADAQRANQTLSDVGGFVFLLVELAHHAGIAFAKSRLVRAALSGMLTVDKGIEIVA